MTKRILTIGLIAAFIVPAVPAIAQRQERVLTIFGDDKCPENDICVRAPERDRYRIPKELRGDSTLPENQSWAARSAATLDTGKSGAGSCTNTGAGGWTGCYMKQMREAREEKKQDEAAKVVLP